MCRGVLLFNCFPAYLAAFLIIDLNPTSGILSFQTACSKQTSQSVHSINSRRKLSCYPSRLFHPKNGRRDFSKLSLKTPSYDPSYDVKLERSPQTPEPEFANMVQRSNDEVHQMHRIMNETSEYDDNWFDRQLQRFLASRIYQLLQEEKLIPAHSNREMKTAPNEYAAFVRAAFRLNARPSIYSQRLTMQLLKELFPSWFPTVFRYVDAAARDPPIHLINLCFRAYIYALPKTHAVRFRLRPPASSRQLRLASRAGASSSCAPSQPPPGAAGAFWASSPFGSTLATPPCPPFSSPAGS